MKGLSMHKNRLLFLTLPFLISSELVLSSSNDEPTSSRLIPVATVLSEKEIEDLADFITIKLGAMFEYPKGLNQEQSLDRLKILIGIKSKYEENIKEHLDQQIATLKERKKKHEAAYASFLKRNPKPKLKELAAYNKTYKQSLESLEKEMSLLSSENSKTKNPRADEFQSIKKNALEELQTYLPDFNFKEN